MKYPLLYLDSIDWIFFFSFFTELILKKYMSPKSILFLLVITLNGQLMNFWVLKFKNQLSHCPLGDLRFLETKGKDSFWLRREFKVVFFFRLLTWGWGSIFDSSNSIFFFLKKGMGLRFSIGHSYHYCFFVIIILISKRIHTKNFIFILLCIWSTQHQETGRG